MYTVGDEHGSDLGYGAMTPITWKEIEQQPQITASTADMGSASRTSMYSTSSSDGGGQQEQFASLEPPRPNNNSNQRGLPNIGQQRSLGELEMLSGSSVSGNNGFRKSPCSQDNLEDK